MCWSGQAEIKFTEKACEILLEEATKLYNMFFYGSIPLVSIDMKWKLARLSSALAYLTISTDDFETVTVTEEHVREVVNFLTDEYCKAGLNTLAQETRFERITLEDVNLIIASIAYATGLEAATIEEIFKFVVIQGRVTRDQIKTTFELAEKNQLRPLLAVLASEKMIRPGRGFYPTQKLIESYKLLNVAKVTKVAKVPEGHPKVSEKYSKNENIRGSSHRVGKVGNLGKTNGKPKQAASKLSNSVTDFTIVECVDLKEPTVETCAHCGKVEILTKQIKTADGKWGHVCKPCGEFFGKVMEKGREAS